MCIEIKDINSKCKFCNQQELDCASMGIIDGILSSPHYPYLVWFPIKPLLSICLEMN